MKRWMKLTGASILAGCICVWAYTVWMLEPARRFDYVDIPVLAVPSMNKLRAPSINLANTIHYPGALESILEE